jgi:hypothetical protein
MTEDVVVAGTFVGTMEAEIVKGLLEASGIVCFLSQEGAARAAGIQIGPMGEVDVLVSKADAQAAKALVDDYLSGRLSPAE